MPLLRVIHTKESEFEEVWRSLRARLTLAGVLAEDAHRVQQVRAIVEGVRRGGDAAVAEFTRAYDGVALRPGEFRVAQERLAAARAGMEAGLLGALRRSIENVRAYQEAIRLRAPADWERGGVRLGVRYRAVRRVGVCVPGSSAPLVSTVIMCAVPALAAGVRELAFITAPRREYAEYVHPAILGLCWELREQWRGQLESLEVYRVSGAQGVAALAQGTESIKRVDKIVGPGNWWGQLAKREVYGLVDVDSFAGPSEVVVLADESAEAAFVAADLLSQAEHAPGSAVLLTDSESLARRAAEAVDQQLETLGRAEATRRCVRECCLAAVTRGLEEAVELANEFAAEHVQVQTRGAAEVAERIVNAGAVFVGPFSPVATGDYYAGPSHALPTGGSARFFGGLSVNDFLKQTSVIRYEASGLRQAAADIETIAAAEGLDGHGRSVRIRLEQGRKP